MFSGGRERVHWERMGSGKIMFSSMKMEEYMESGLSGIF